jgi:hypothetical protein
MMRLVLKLVAASLLSAALFGALDRAANANHRLQPVVFVASPEPEYRAHGRPTIGLLGLSFCLAVFALHAIAVWSLLTWRMGDGASGSWLRLAAPVFALDLAYVAIVYPYFLVAVLPETVWVTYSALVERYLPPLYDIYAHWAWPRYVAHIVLVHGILVWLVAIAYWRLSRRTDRRQAVEGRESGTPSEAASEHSA